MEFVGKMPRICLIADGDPFITRLLRRFGEECGLQVIQAQSGQDVLDTARQFLPAVIILDPELPGKLRGWDVLRSLREDPQTCHISIITCSWLQIAEVTARVGEVQGNLQKPELHYDTFLEALRRIGLDLQDPPALGG